MASKFKSFMTSSLPLMTSSLSVMTNSFFLSDCSCALSLTALKEVHLGVCMPVQGVQNETALTSSNHSSIQRLARSKKLLERTAPIQPQKAAFDSPKKSCFISHPESLSAVMHQCLFQNTLQSSTFDDLRSYKCPSVDTGNDINLVILDNVASVTTSYECPVFSVIDNMKAPSIHKPQIIKEPGISSPMKEASIIMRIRHKKMKKHQRRKLLKRMYFVWKKEKLARKKKRMNLFYSELEEIKKAGDNFSAEDFVKEQLAKARKGGYSIDVFSSKAGN